MRNLLLIVLLVVVSLAPSVQGDPLTPEFEISVSIEHTDQPLEPWERYKIPVHIEVVCTKYAPITTTQNMHFTNYVSLVSSSEPINYDYQETWGHPFSLNFCTSGAVIQHTFHVTFAVPSRYPGLSDITLGIAVSSDEGIGNGTDSWQTSVRFVDDVKFSSGPGIMINSDRDKTFTIVTMSNKGNAAVSASVSRSDMSHPGLMIEDYLLSAESFNHDARVTDVYLDESIRGQTGQYNLILDVEAWLTDHPDHRLRPAQLSFTVEIRGGGVLNNDAPAIGYVAGLLLAVMVVVLARRTHS